MAIQKSIFLFFVLFCTHGLAQEFHADTGPSIRVISENAILFSDSNLSVRSDSKSIEKGTVFLALTKTEKAYQILDQANSTNLWISKGSVVVFPLPDFQKAICNRLNQITADLTDSKSAPTKLVMEGTELCDQLTNDHMETYNARRDFLSAASEQISSRQKYRLARQEFRFCIRQLGEYDLRTQRTLAEMALAVVEVASNSSPADAVLTRKQHYEYCLKNLGKFHPATVNAFAVTVASFSELEEFQAANRFADELLLKVRTQPESDNIKRATKAKDGLKSAVAGLCDTLGRNADAVDLLKEALSSTETKYGKASYQAKGIRNSLFFPLIGQRDYDLIVTLMSRNVEFANDELERVAAIQKKAFATMELGDTDGAINQWRECLTIFESASKENARFEQQTLAVQSQIATAMSKAGRVVESITLSKQILNKKIELLGADHAHTRLTKHALAMLYCVSGDRERANQLLRSTVGQNISNDAKTAVFLARTGEIEAAERVQQFVENRARYGDDRKLHDSLPEIYLLGGKNETAIDAQEQRLKEYKSKALFRLARLLPKNRSHYLNIDFRPFVDKSLSLILAAGRKTDSIDQRSFEWALNTKTLSNELLSRSLKLDSPQASSLKNQLATVTKQLSNLSRLNPQQNAEIQERLRTLGEARSSLELSLTKLASLNFSDEWITANQFRATLSKDSCFLAISKIDRFDFQSSKEKLVDVWGAPVYVAWFVPPMSKGEVQLFELGPASRIDNVVIEIKTALRQTLSESASLGEQGSENKLKRPLQDLTRLIYEPLENLALEFDELIVSPDGELWGIPWEMLVSKERYLIEKHRFRYLSSGRELNGKSKGNGHSSHPVIFANPDYGAELTQATSVNKKPIARTASKFSFQPLPMTAIEAQAVKPFIESRFGDNVELLTGAKASESHFKTLNQPEILVMSTHGYFNRDSRLENPLLRCGLALAGCNSSRVLSENQEDGIISGLEIVSSKLQGTKLVVLSACESGVGEVQNGEGVASLRQAFQLAGAESVISSLWQVEDGETTRLMKLFFENLAGGKLKSAALRQAQLTRIKARRTRHGAAHPFFWAAFTLTGQD